MLYVSVLLIVLMMAGIAATSSLFKAVLMLMLCMVAIVIAVAPAIGQLACVFVAGVLVSIAGFAFVAPWIICLRAPYDDDVCPLDAETRKDIQRARIKWTLTLTIVALSFVLKISVVEKIAGNPFKHFFRSLLSKSIT